MPVLRLTPAEYTITRWSGGTTAQIAIAPSSASYQERDFLWRISSAEVEDEWSVFTPLPEYRRCLVLLEGSLLLSHDGGAPFRLRPFQVHEFDGDAATESVGLCRDFNLMLRKGKCRGSLRPLRFSGAGELVLCCRPPDAQPCPSRLLYCASGGGRAAHMEEACDLLPGESLLLESGGELRLAAPEAADFILAEIFC